QIDGNQQHRTNHHQERALADPIGKPSKERRSKHSEDSQHAYQIPARFASRVVRIHEELVSEGLKREDRRIEDNAKRDDIPVGKSKRRKIPEPPLVGRTGWADLVALLRITLHAQVEQGSSHAESSEYNRDQQRTPPLAIRETSPRGR